MKSKNIIFFLIIIIFLSGCQSQALTADNLPWISEGKVLFKDDFTYQLGGWRTFEDSLSKAAYQSGGFRLWANAPHFQIWTNPGLNFQDTLIFTRAKKIAGPNDNLFGVLCRFQDSKNFYAFVIGSDGYYGIYKMVSGQQHLIDQVHLDFSEKIKTGEEENELTALCHGNQLALIVNDIRLIQVSDDTFKNGDVGLIAGNFSEPGIDIVFDDFIVINP